MRFDDSAVGERLLRELTGGGSGVGSDVLFDKSFCEVFRSKVSAIWPCDGAALEPDGCENLWVLEGSEDRAVQLG